MPIDAVSGAGGGIYTAEPARAPKQKLDSEAFMSLLITQLQNQDPSSPMDTTQMIAQTTQLAMMEQLTNMATTNEENFSLRMRTAAAGLLGQEVSYTGPDGETVTGIASSVSFARPVPTVTVAGVEVPLDAVSGVQNNLA